ncbi:FusB/FusC family EF-G-binding protein [Staphylococcus durrellii]|uniref:FusB/FusC family EF-G-binding protein n=1 Tax=Staphylococcus durrellii TaxID=2781773 RepID=UPI00189D1D2F|nr:FusB/FusC family EF-G-binding protein [Staphylococcus durrellii]MBF7017824.1 FusB/FusC family EF-G-binding protein [Staphylococcus durrellii]
MENKIYPYQFNYIKNNVARLLNVYNSVNDKHTVTAIQQTTKEDILQTFPKIDATITNAIDTLMDVQLSSRQTEKILETLKSYVTPFEHPSNKQVEKVFKKVKKLKTPLISDEVLIESTYVGWNDISSGRKYIIYYDEYNKLNGFYGDISNQTFKGFCSICNKESNVALFMRKTHSSSDGRYTKKGDYICFDSTQCNRQITDLTHFYKFWDKIKS